MINARDPVIAGADLLAGEVCRLVDSGRIDARSPAGDALLDYAQTRHREAGPSRWIQCVRDRRLEILAERKAAGGA